MGCWVLLGDMTPQANDFPLGEGEKGVAVTLHAGVEAIRAASTARIRGLVQVCWHQDSASLSGTSFCQ